MMTPEHMCRRKMCVHVQSGSTLHDPWTVAYQVHHLWDFTGKNNGVHCLSLSRGFSDPGTESMSLSSPTLQDGFFPTLAPPGLHQPYMQGEKQYEMITYEKKEEEETWVECPDLFYNWRTGSIILNQKLLTFFYLCSKESDSFVLCSLSQID